MGLEPHRSAESRMTICGSHTTLTLLEKQRQVLTLLSNRWQGEQERLIRRLNRFQAA